MTYLDLSFRALCPCGASSRARRPSNPPWTCKACGQRTMRPAKVERFYPSQVGNLIGNRTLLFAHYWTPRDRKTQAERQLFDTRAEAQAKCDQLNEQYWRLP